MAKKVSKEAKKKYNKTAYEKDKAGRLAQNRSWYQKNPEKALNQRLKKDYGITLDTYKQMAQKQNGKCAICGNEEKLFVDHNHGTGRVRELLCNKCNTALGMIRENVSIAKSLVDYLVKHND